MNWQNILTTPASAFDERGRAVLIPDSCALDCLNSDAVVMPLGHYASLTISGPDTHKFLQGQLSCDMQTLTPENALAGALCTPKGRMVSNFYLQYLAADQVLLLLPSGTLPATQTTLSKYIVFSKAEMQAEQQWCHLGLVGSQAASLVARLFGKAPPKRLGCIHAENGSAICISPQQHRYLLTLPSTDLAQQWRDLTEVAKPVNSNVWDYLDICAGLGFVQEQTIEMFIPQMLNLQLTDGVSFTKGCYTGQEIVARTEYRGNLKRRMYRATASANAVPEPGTAIFSSAKEQPVGNIVTAEQAATDGVEMLIVAALSESREESLHLSDKQGPHLQLLDLPYSFAD
ncbi:MAG: YgfZ/GcvT domain-containing protein [Pseudomonadales bacterium]